ncbi:ABC transporter permease [Actinacidiphila paucisporea]|uniref:Putative ABC transport system permease protein n=1 Tax=Actinacidiphila paucisporea TaxID=310782 RepID=A0A1M7BS98_9ACTN|nr:ABC transporter permease [Actinacidiphila paucisporea]SHL57803.1 putative ABC transport system permease protein [Actinacidiphila paucisporea]
MSALGKVVRAGVGRRRVQTVVMVLTTMTAVTASIMAGGLVVASRAPFDHAFAEQHGAHLTGRFDGTKATGAQIAATAHTAGVTAAAGPFAVVSASPRFASDGMVMEGLPPLTIAGRAAGGGPVDAVTLDQGHWVTGPGQIVLTKAEDGPVMGRVGGTVSFPGLPGKPSLTIVGLARSVSRTADAWVAPAEIPALTGPRATPSYEMLYRFAHAGTGAELSRDRDALAAAVPRGALTGTASYLATKHTADQETATFVPFIVAFGVLGLVMSVLIIGIVVSGAVSAGTRRIGVLKSLGLTPGQVGRAYVGQALIPATVGTASGVVVGNLASVPLLAQASDAYGAASLTVAWWLDLAVPAGVLALVVASALAPALRAARLRTVEALAIGRTPRVGRGRLAARLASRLPLSRALTLGLAGPFARPARSATIWAAVAFGAIGVTFAFGLGSSLSAIQNGLNRDAPGEVAVDTFAPPSGPPPGGGPSHRPAPADAAAVGRAIAAQSGTAGYFGTGHQRATFTGVPGAVDVTTYRGDSSWGALQMVSGHWLDGPRQLVVGRRFLEAAGKHVGDTVTLEGDGRSVQMRIVGEALTVDGSGMRVAADTAAFTALGADTRPDTYQVHLAHGTDRAAYLRDLNTALRPVGVTAVGQSSQVSGTVIAMDTMIAMLTVMLVAVAGLGVLNTVVLDTRERVHDLGVMKALGMAPRQTVAMVVTSVAGIGAVAGVVGVPLGIALHDYVIPAMGTAAGTHIPPSDLHVYHPLPVLLLALSGLAIAVAGALLPATWSARTSTASSLRTE